jgi:hypothetical protein
LFGKLLWESFYIKSWPVYLYAFWRQDRRECRSRSSRTQSKGTDRPKNIYYRDYLTYNQSRNQFDDEWMFHLSEELFLSEDMPFLV